MKKYTLKRILTSIFTLLVILLVLFILMQLMPGSPFNDEKLNNDQRAALYAKYGLDRPIIVQFFHYAKNMLKGDLGVSYNISKNTPHPFLVITFHENNAQTFSSIIEELNLISIFFI